MEIIKKASDIQRVSLIEKVKGKTIGFVPTMGFLHEGHETLIKEAREQNDIVVLSIFVNPLQFGPNEDFDAYPRDMKRDEDIAKKLKVDYLFYPTTDEMYPGEPATIIKAEKRVDVLCGKYRPGHFDGVATVVMKLFQLVAPNKAYFGMKDAQQVAVIEGLINDYFLPVTLVRVDTVREADGLAKSSRNVYLSKKEREVAPVIYKALLLGKEMVLKGNSTNQVKGFISNIIGEQSHGEIEYVEIYSYPTLVERNVTETEDTIIIAVAVKFSKARLIDNIVFSYDKGE